jgi:hypothetical protein
MMRLGNPDMFEGDQGLLGQEEVSHAWMSLVEAVLVEALLFTGVCWDVMVFAAVLAEAQAWMTDPAEEGTHVASVQRGV